MKVSGESESADVKAAEAFLETLDKWIVEDNYLPEQIFHMYKCFQFWNWMPKRAFIRQEAKSMPGFKDRVTVLLGGSVAGCRVNPAVSWHSESPGACTHIS